MSRVEQLEDEIKALLPNEFRELRAWLDEYDARVWDEQFNADACSRKLDAVADLALKDLCEGRSAIL
jgi:hypothetical protein